MTNQIELDWLFVYVAPKEEGAMLLIDTGRDIARVNRDLQHAKGPIKAFLQTQGYRVLKVFKTIPEMGIGVHAVQDTLGSEYIMMDPFLMATEYPEQFREDGWTKKLIDEAIIEHSFEFDTCPTCKQKDYQGNENLAQVVNIISRNAADDEADEKCGEDHLDNPIMHDGYAECRKCGYKVY